MKTEVKALTPINAGLSLTVCSGPRGEVGENEWPCIAYTLQLQKAGKPVWTGDYKLGVGHVKPKSYDDLRKRSFEVQRAFPMTADEENCSHHWSKGTRFNTKDPRTAQLQASTAAKLALIQKVVPKLEEVCHSLLCDGSAYFDGNTFENWAQEFGYSSDSIKARATFEACDKIGRALNRALTREELAGLREWAGNY